MRLLDFEWLDVLKEVAREVYSVVHPLLGSSESNRIVGSGFGGDETMLIDEVAEETIIRYLKKNSLSCTFIGEERGVQNIGNKSTTHLIVDAVDGSTNAVRGIGFASSSLAVSSTAYYDDLEAAVVINLVNGGIYEAEKEEGARYNGETIRTSETAGLRNCVLSIDISRSSEAVEIMVPVMKAAKSVRSLGSAALEICHVASGSLEAYVDIRSTLRMLDIAAGILILEEAGGVCIQPDGKRFRGTSLTEMNRFSVVASASMDVYHDIVSLMKKST